jgi:thioredoxin-related protein
MKKQTFLLSLLFCVTVLSLTLRAQGVWSTDYRQALEQASRENKEILLDFTGSDWCPHCKILVEKVFSQSVFQEFANKNLILVEVDFPKSKIQSDALKKQNEELQSQYQVTCYPTLILLDSKGNEVQRSHGTSSPEELIKWVLDKP